MKKFTLFICALVLSFASFAQVSTYPESGPGMCNGSANLYGPYMYGDLYSVNDTLNPMQTNSLNFYSLCAGAYFIKGYDSLMNPTRFDFNITTDLCGNFYAYTYPNQVSAPGMCDGSAGLNVNGGTAPFTYNWSNGQTTQNATGLCEGSYTVTVMDMNACSTSTTVNITAPSPCQSFFVDIQPFAVSDSGMCDGAAKAWPQNGAAPYTYNWSNSATTDSIGGLCAGNYNVTVVDSLGCQYTQYVDILVYDPCMNFYVNTQPFGVSDSGMCDGSAVAHVVNGLAPFTYSWSNSATTDSISSLCEGGYNVTVTDANNCSFNQYVTIQIVSPCQMFNATITSTNTSDTACTGSATVIVNNGSGSYSYNWNHNGDSSQTVNNLCAGSYTVNVVDLVNGCQSYPYANVNVDNGNPCQNFYVTVNTVPANDSALCNGQADVIAYNGVAPFSYTWSTGDTLTNGGRGGLCVGTHSVVVWDANGCSVTYPNIIIADGTNPCNNFAVNLVTYPITDTVNCNGSVEAQTINGVAPYTYLWNDNSTNNNILGICTPGEYTVTVTDNNGCTQTQMAFVGQDSLNPACNTLTLSVNFVDASAPGMCDGTAGAVATGGSGNYAFSWSTGDTLPNISNLCAGTYTAYMIDFSTNCQKNFTFGIADSAANPCANSTLAVAAQSSSNPSVGMCNGQAFANVTGGVAPYTYYWTSGETQVEAVALCEDAYTVTVTDANGCTATASIIMMADSGNPCLQNPITLNVTPTDATTFGTCDGTISSTVTGGTPAYTYLWSNGSTAANTVGLCAGTYDLTITDSNGCTATASATINNPDMCPTFTASATATNASDVSCVGTVTVSTTGGSGQYSFAWSDSSLNGSNLLNLCAGTYTVTVTDLVYGCMNTASAVVAIDSTPNPCLGFQVVVNNTINETAPSAGDGQALASTYGGTAPFVYNWGNGIATDTAYISGLFGGSFTMNVTDANGCTAFANGFVGTTTPSTGPCAGVIIDVNLTSVNATAGMCDGSITSTVSGGTMPYTYSWNNGYLTSSYLNACPGNYNLQVVDANGCIGAAATLVNGDPMVTVPLVVNITTTNTTDTVNCNGGVRVNVSGGTAPYIISYSTGAAGPQLNNLCDDIYSVSVVDANGQAASFTFVIANESSVFTSTSNPLNDSVVVASITADAMEDCNIDVDVVDSVMVSNYWIDDATDSLLVQWVVYSSTAGNMEVYQIYGVGPEGVYEVVLTIYCSGRATKGFVKAYDKVQVNARLTSLVKNKGVAKSEVYPNPFNNSLNIKVSTVSSVVITDVAGKVVANFNGLNGNSTIVTDNLSKGIYFVTIQNNNSKEVVKVVKE